jgi:hypothetical protein
MVETTDAADAHEPTGDPEHVAFGSNYYWTCTCGRSAPFMTTQRKAMSRGSEHERHCTGEATVEVSVV